MATKDSGHLVRFVQGVRTSTAILTNRIYLLLESPLQAFDDPDNEAIRISLDTSGLLSNEWKSHAETRAIINVANLATVTVIATVTLTAGMRVLLTAQTDPKQNGVYSYIASGGLVRASDANSDNELRDMVVYVRKGSGAGERWRLSNTGSAIPGTDNLTYTLVESNGDKAKLDGIEPGAQVVTWASIVTAGATAGADLAINGRAITACTALDSSAALTLTSANGNASLDSDSLHSVNIGATSLTVNIGHGTIPITLTGVLHAKRDAIGAADTVGVTLENTTSSGSTENRPPMLRQSGYGHDSAGGGAQVFCAVDRTVRLVTASGNPEIRIHKGYVRTGGSGGTSSGDFGHYWSTSLPGLGGLGLYLSADSIVLGASSGGIRGEAGGNGGLSIDAANDWDVILDGGTAGRRLDKVGSGIVQYRSWGAKVFEEQVGNAGLTSDASDTVIVTYAAVDSSTYHVVAKLTARNAGSDYASYTRTATFRRNGGTLAQVGTTETTYSNPSGGFSTCAADISASGANIRAVVRGVALTSIQWSCVLTVTRHTP